MTINDIFCKYSFTQRTIKDFNINLNVIENKLGHKLPSDYTNYISNYGEVELYINDHIVFLYDFVDLLVINDDYKIFEKCSDLFLIGSNASGEGIAIDFGHDQRIVLVPLIDLEKEYFIEIGSSFTNMFERLEQGKEWFK